MKVYGKTTSTERKVQRIFCNQCGRSMKIENGIVREGIFSAEVSFGYFSKKTVSVRNLIYVKSATTG